MNRFYGWMAVAFSLAALGCTRNACADCGGTGATPAEVRPLAFVRTADFAPLTVGARRRCAAETLLFAEFQVKYGVFHNYLNKWIDRPLFFDRALRPDTFAYETAESFAIHAREVRNAGLDGFNLFTGKGRLKDILEKKAWLKEKGFGDLQVLPTLGYGDDGNRTADPEIFLQTIAMAKDDPSFPRVNGKVLVPTYNYNMFKPEEHRTMLGKIDAQLGRDSYALCGYIDPVVVYELQQKFGRGEKLTDADLARLDRAIADVLSITGGIQLRAEEMKRPYDGQYCTLYDFTFFDAVMVPAIERAYARPENVGKLLGFYVLQGYVNHMSGNDNSEDGTGTLRRYLRSVARVNPDYLLFFEWNEVNENTMYQPTVWGGRTAARILRWTSRTLKGLKPDVFPGDDVSVPPLALTYRATCKPGEELHFEVLNVPDGVTAGTLNARLRLRDLAGRPYGDFPLEPIPADAFGAIDYLVRTVDIPGGTVLTPTLEVNGKSYSGFAPIRFDPTVSWNYKTVRQSLRDLLVPTTVRVSAKIVGPDRTSFACAASFAEPLASLELVANETEQAALDPAHEYDYERNRLVELLVSVPRGKGSGYGRMDVRLVGAKDWKATPHYTANINSGVPAPFKDGTGFSVNTLFWGERVGYYLQIPRTGDPTDVFVEVSRPDRKDWKTVRLPLRVVLEKGSVGAFLDDEANFLVEVRKMLTLPDLPPHLGLKEVDWKGTTETGARYPVFHFRAISKSGRIWRSPPLRAEGLPTEPVTVPVFDEYGKKVSTLVTPSALVPELVYDFDPRCGASLVNGGSPFFNAQLGAGTWYCEPFCDPRIVCAPGARAPARVVEDGAPALRFDGVNDYVNFPKEAFPCGAFTLDFTVKPVDSGTAPRVLFRHYDFIRGSLSLYLDGGELVAVWGDRDLSREPRIRTGLGVRDGAWSRIVVSYDYRTFRFAVNDATFEFPFEGRPFRFKPSTFGGHDKVELSPRPPVKPAYFKGFLKALSIRHR